jgi:hypothetical protein
LQALDRLPAELGNSADFVLLVPLLGIKRALHESKPKTGFRHSPSLARDQPGLEKVYALARPGILA